jgi:hypothetical protein
MCCFYLCCVVRQRPLVSLFTHRDQGGLAMYEWFSDLVFQPMITGQDPWTIAIVLDDYLRWLFNAPPRT